MTRNVGFKQTTTERVIFPETTTLRRTELGRSHGPSSLRAVERTGTQEAYWLPHRTAAGSELHLVPQDSGCFVHDFSQIPVHPTACPKIQTKQVASYSEGGHEQEADRTADQVMYMPEPKQQHECSGGSCHQYGTEQYDLHPERLQTTRAETHQNGSNVEPPGVHSRLTSGRPLYSSIRKFMEPRFGHDFGQVRVHTDKKAGDSAVALGALAFTVGHDISFAPTQYAPETAEGRHLLAHELTHVILQRSSFSDTVAVMRKPKPIASEFESCTGKQAHQIESVVQKATSALRRALSVVAGAYGRPKALKATDRQLLLEHFHTTDHDDLLEILRTYTSIQLAFEAGLEFQCETTCEKSAKGKTCGYAYNTMWFGGRGPIHICFDAAGCDFTTTKVPNQVALVIHEAAHRHAGIDDKVYEWTSKYATLSASDAMDNADSYAWFAADL